ncbi:MFS transporter [Cytophaga hutchinsonii]|jgi:FHS family L-fucose permease-like MFS transporter|uniref:Fucose permease n=1 Tax=Cytophaga hutchinsonii (strain ATCC 33406 / DSM 1761 / CIP 103989 / NBRC 15051 / NCIMB 9469 / D465) TaxID=269798 RepID=A0A6N4SWQ8_CYTH3|nr:MFS transporter [Cytophaga hutchinsonii]ABG60839.1 fucose permease [Cytophaga hutchinsonii ATCC 33406]SFX72941.1 MFS transporter, FHS family, L-fucose permease [Cytophaga hutchinsonii ATCC 33406]
MYSNSNTTINYTKVFLVLSTLFFMWGLITVLNISLIEELRDVFQLSFEESLSINLALYGTYFIIALPAGWVINKVGFRKGIIIGAGLASFGCFLFYPAAASSSFVKLLLALFVLGSGFTFLQVAANPYVALLGMRGKGAAKLSFIQAFNSFGTFLAPLLAGGLFLSIAGLKPTSFATMAPEELMQHKILLVQMPYLLFGSIWFLLMLIVTLSELPRINMQDQPPLIRNNEKEPRKFLLQYPQVVNGAITLFLYVGAEVSLAYYISMKSETLIPYYWGCALLGRFIGAGLLFVATSPRKMMKFSGSVALFLLLVYMIINNDDKYIVNMNQETDPALYLLVLIGLCNSVIWPTVFTMGIDGMGKYSINASALLVMSVFGGAVIPFIFIYLLTDYSIISAFPILLIAYGFLIWFGSKGSIYEKKNNFY